MTPPTKPLRILALSDIHDEFEKWDPRSLPDPSLVDVVMYAGDFTNYGMRKPAEVERAAAWLRAMTLRYRTVRYVLGNHDIGITGQHFDTSEAGVLVSCRNIDVIANPYPNNSGLSMLPTGQWVTGINLSPCFEMPSLKTQWTNMTDDRETDADAFAALPAARIVLSHCPPENVLDYGGTELVTRREFHFGSPGLATYIRKNKPRLVICGHVHESSGVETVGFTTVVNTARRMCLITIHADIDAAHAVTVSAMVTDTAWAASFPMESTTRTELSLF